MKTYLIPRESRFFPSMDIRNRSHERVNKYGPESFETYGDWFFFIHIDPIQRYIHAIGMIVGLYLYVMMFLKWNYTSFYYYLAATFFFYGTGIISHLVYDNGGAKSNPRFFHHTFPKVIFINFLTITGCYDQYLRKFIKKYSFVKESYDLTEIPLKDFTMLFRGELHGLDNIETHQNTDK